MLTKEKVIAAMQTLPAKFSREELLQHLLLLEEITAATGEAIEIAEEAEIDAATEDFKEWASLT